ncbi:MAG: LysM peptidoglycan-binding domain-containing protein [Sulfurovum sp.]|nr:LysM peptidoglycan-binding domain-containing protein [Sulfurovum sp.]
MNKIYTSLFSFFVLLGPLQAKSKTIEHKIKSGETLYTVAHENHTTIEEVRKANGLVKGETLKIGRVLKVPTDTYIAKKKANTSALVMVEHSIENGETLFTVAHKYHTTIEEVRKTNGLKKGEVLKIGRILKVPKDTYVAKIKVKPPVLMAKHSIENGETLFTVARKYSTTVEEVRKANGLVKGDILKIGRVIEVPKNTYVAEVVEKKKKPLKVVRKAKTPKKTYKVAKKKKFKKKKICKEKVACIYF